MIGLPTNVGLAIAKKNKAKELDVIAKQPINKRAIDEFRKNIVKIKSADDLIKDFKTYSFAMKAFDLEDQIFGKGLMKKVFESDPNDPKSLVNRLTDPKIKAIFKYFDFSNGGKDNLFTDKEFFADGIVRRYMDLQFENRQYEKNTSVGTALYAQRKIPDVKNWFNVLADAELTFFFTTALNLPENLRAYPIDKQKQLLERKFDINKLKDPKEIDKLVKNFGALADVKTNMALSQQQNFDRFSGANNRFGFNPVTINIAAVNLSAIGRYNRS